jgi:heme exporter protein C
MQRYLTPGPFFRLAGAVLPWVSGATVLLLGLGLYLGLFVAPPDYQQGESVRIMYVHVPAAWMALFVYMAMAGASAVSLIWKNPVADLLAKAAAPIGAGFTFIALVTGSLWGKPMWGAWWVWDARLTSMLVLLFLYIGYIALTNAFDDPAKGSRIGAILALVGFINVPIIKFSVEWWNTLHQGASVLRAEGPAIDFDILAPLLIMALAFTSYFVAVLLLRMRSERLARRIRALRLDELAG